MLFVTDSFCNLHILFEISTIVYYVAIILHTRHKYYHFLIILLRHKLLLMGILVIIDSFCFCCFCCFLFINIQYILSIVLFSCLYNNLLTKKLLKPFLLKVIHRYIRRVIDKVLLNEFIYSRFHTIEFLYSL